jgi:hypothetical protein
LIEQLRGQVTELSQAFEKVNVEANPRFQQQFNKPIERAKEGARTLLTTLGLDADLFDRTMALTGKARIEAMDDLAEAIKSPSVNGQLLNLVSQIDNLEAQKREVLSDVKGNAAKLQQEQRARYAVEVQEQEKRLSSILDQTITHLRDKSGSSSCANRKRPAARSTTRRWRASLRWLATSCSATRTRHRRQRRQCWRRRHRIIAQRSLPSARRGWKRRKNWPRSRARSRDWSGAGTRSYMTTRR